MKIGQHGVFAHSLNIHAINMYIKRERQLLMYDRKITFVKIDRKWRKSIENNKETDSNIPKSSKKNHATRKRTDWFWCVENPKGEDVQANVWWLPTENVYTFCDLNKLCVCVCVSISCCVGHFPKIFHSYLSLSELYKFMAFKIKQQKKQKQLKNE